MHLSSLPGIKASVWSGGVELKEYDDPEEPEGPLSEMTAQKYLEAIDGATFEIKLEALSSYKFDCQSVGCAVYVDGIYITFPCLEPKFLGSTVRGQRKSTANSVTLRKFMFSKIELTEEPSNANHPKSVDTIGEIRIELFRISFGGPKSYNSNHPNAENAPEKLSEKQLKGRAVSHGTSYGVPEVTYKAVNMARRSAIYIDGKNKPIAILKMLYRSKAALQSILVIPRTPSPPRSGPATVRNFRSLQGEVKFKSEMMVKQEYNDGSSSGGGRKKRASNVIIDLTGDDNDDEPNPVPLKKFKTEDGQPGIDLT